MTSGYASKRPLPLYQTEIHLLMVARHRLAFVEIFREITDRIGADPNSVAIPTIVDHGRNLELCCPLLFVRPINAL